MNWLVLSTLKICCVLCKMPVSKNDVAEISECLAAE